LDGNGIQTLSVNSGVNFDLLANGQPVQTGWVGAGDGLLVLDHNQDGIINDGSELFGSSTVLADGSKAVDGYQALSQLDTNKDGVISSADAQFAKLGVWVDGNADGQTGIAELKSLTDLNISQLNLNAQVTTEINNGNLVGLTSSYQTSDGVSHTAADVWFEVQPVLPRTVSTSKLAQAIGLFDGVSAHPEQADFAKGLSNQIKADDPLIPATLMVQTMRAYMLNDAPLVTGTFDMNLPSILAGAGNLATSVTNDDKVKSSNSLDANGISLFLNSKI
jgi:hypothetical protein